MKFNRTILAGALALGLAGAFSLPAFAQDSEIMDLPEGQLGKYAGFAKLESNLSEVTSGLLLQKLLPSEYASRAIDIDDLDQDIAAAEAYVRKLGEMDLSASERESLDQFLAGWGDLMTAKDEIFAADEVSSDALLAYFEKASVLDELIDGVLDSLLADAAVTN